MKRPNAGNSRFLRLFPELALFDEDEGADALLNAYKETRWIPKLVKICLIGVGMPLAPVVAGAFSPRVQAFMDAHEIVGVGLIAAGVSITTGIVGLWLARDRMQRSLRRQLLEAGRPVCIECGYDLRGQIEPRCPECGTAFDRTLLRPPRHLDKQ
jgi:hypothetical protein